MNRFAYYAEYINNSVPSRKLRSQRIDWRSVAALGLMAAAVVFAFGGSQ